MALAGNSILVLVALVSYAIGSVPAARLVASRFTGVCPICGIKASALASVLLDIFKGLIVVLAARQIFGPEVLSVSVAAVFIGHVYPLWNLRSGGKGMGVLLGALIALNPTYGLIAITAWTIAFYVYRNGSLSALISTVATTGIVMFASELATNDTHLFLLLTVFVLWRHRREIPRLVKHTEDMVIWD